MHVRFSDRAIGDLTSIKEFLESRSPQGLDRILAAIFTTAAQLETFPLLGHRGAVDGTYELIVPRTDFRLIYTLDDPLFVDIEHVLHGSRKYPFEDD